MLYLPRAWRKKWPPRLVHRAAWAPPRGTWGKQALVHSSPRQTPRSPVPGRCGPGWRRLHSRPVDRSACSPRTWWGRPYGQKQHSHWQRKLIVWKQCQMQSFGSEARKRISVRFRIHQPKRKAAGKLTAGLIAVPNTLQLNPTYVNFYSLSKKIMCVQLSGLSLIEFWWLQKFGKPYSFHLQD